MAISKLILNGVTQMDVTQDTVAAGNLLSGETATGADGEPVVGSYTPPASVTVESLSVNQNGTYTAPSGKAYSPVTVNVAGGGGSAESKAVNFIDYDGTITNSYTAAEFAELSAMPSNPSHTGLVAQGWNWSLSDAQAYVAKYGMLTIGQMYITQSGDTEIDITLDNADYLSPYLAIAVNGTVEVDWGDGTAKDTMTGTSNTTLKYQLHEYAATGSYTISIHVASGRFTFYGETNYASVLRAVNAANNRAQNRTYSGSITEIRMGSGAYVGNYAFSGCYALTSITIPDGVTSIGNFAFQNCYSLTSITIPDGVTSISINGFQNCYSLTSITIPDGVTSIGSNGFQSCYSLTSITIPDGVTSIGSNGFQGCYSLTSVTIPDGVTSIGTIAFQSCYSLTSITIPDGVTSIGNYAFQNCYSLTSITIPDGVTSIGSNGFQGCYSLTSVTIPDGVTSIGSNGFNNCYAVEEYHFLPTTPPTLAGTNAFTGIMEGTIMYVPYSEDHSILEAYKTATNWSTYASYMQEEPQ